MSKTPNSADGSRAPGARLRRALGCAVCAAAVLLPADAARGQGRHPWDWSLDAGRYKKMNMFERAQYDKAAELFRQGSYKAAAREFEKFRAQFADSAAIAHVLFMHAYANHYAKNRHTAVKLYTEVLDYFPEEFQDASAAIYFMGQAHLDNGDVRKGLAVMKRMVEHERYHKHWLAAGALRLLADNHWKNGQYETAVEYWKQVVRDFEAANRVEARQAKEHVVAWYVNGRSYTGYEAWVVNEDNHENPAFRKGVVQYALWVLDRIRNYPLKTGEKEDPQRRLEDRKAFVKYFKGNRTWYEKTDDLWGYWVHLWTLARGIGDKTEATSAIDEVVQIIKAIKDDRARDSKWSWLIDRLLGEGGIERARICTGYMKDRLWSAWKVYEILARQEKWPEVDKQLQALEKMGDEKWAFRALKVRANVYKDRLRWYEKAIQLYHQISEPPQTLWSIQECYYRWGKLKEALRVLAEIETMFPPHASRAAWTATAYYDRAGESKTAIAGARRILKIYKKSRESSLAHQLLEKYKKKTGGGVLEEEEF